uniref:Cytochrome P450 n=1 Tax=Oryza nivara TaxID=4536 RepID=A0A0E0IV77_ORYNI
MEGVQLLLPVAQGANPCIALVTAGMAVLATACWLVIRLVFVKGNTDRRPCEADGMRMVPGSRGLPIIGETLEFLALSPSLQIPAFFQRRLDSYDSSTSDGKMWKQYDAFTQGLFAFPLCIPGTAFYKCMQMLKEILDERKNTEEHHESVDFFDVIEEVKAENPDQMTENAALDLLFLLLFASFETTSSGITAMLIFLTDNPEALQELIEEHNNIRKRKADKNSEITWEEYKSMKFTSHVIHEALRLASIAPVMFREAIEDVHIKGFAIPKGSKIMICPYTVHLNPVVYKDPNTFNPWRWKDFMAFGGGLRLCVGAHFAKLQMAVFLHCLVTSPVGKQSKEEEWPFLLDYDFLKVFISNFSQKPEVST